MYKSKLQEVCQKRSWSLPKYTTTKHGLDHNPSFSATVILNNDMLFHTTTLFNSSKEAQNDAARLAFQHLSLPQMPSIPSSSSFPQPSLSAQDTDIAHATTESLLLLPYPNEITPLVRENRKFRDVQHLYKLELQIYAQKRNIVFPVYSCEREGPTHASRFKCSVAIDGKTYKCLEYFPTLKEAEHAAAKLALASLSPEGAQNDDSLIYKNLLQEIAQKNGIHLPIYATQTSGEAHCPIFISSVEVKGQSFVGHEAKTKKQAEISAAKVAYNSLKECDPKSIHIPPVLPPSQQVQGAFVTSLQQHVGLSMGTLSNTSKTSVHQAEDSTSSNVLTGSNLETVPCVTQFKSNDEASSPFTCSSFGDSSLDELSTNIGDLSLNESSTKIKLVYKKICVYPANKPIPGGSTLLPIRDQNWIAFCPPEATC